ncbi:MAG: PEGA domain-containing protein [Spirochaetes bacterium]|nr:PEGA domain-containing protein [Spirochaetota bacterium]
MTRRKKQIYLIILFAVFIATIPVIVLFSSGYRLDSRLKLVKTGGIYLHINQSGAAVKINGKALDKTNLLEDNIFIQDLLPETYYAEVEKPGYRPWRKNVEVREQKVEACYPMLIPLKLDPEWIPEYNAAQNEKGEKKRSLNKEYSDAMELFKNFNKPEESILPAWTDSLTKKLRLGPDRKLKEDVFLYRRENIIFAEWKGAYDRMPYFLNPDKKTCAFSSEKKILSFGFFPERNDSILVLLENGDLFAVEIDRRFDIHNIYRIAKKCEKFATADERLYFLAEKILYRIDFSQ